jgi:hypothetical protein
VPARRPSSIAGKPEFADAMAYLRFTAETRRENRASVEWWDTFLLEAPSIEALEAQLDEAPVKRRKRRRRKRGRSGRTPAVPLLPPNE